MTTQLSLIPGIPPRDLSPSAPSYAERAREVAAKACAERGSVTADDVRDALGPPPNAHVSGALFNNDCWLEVGRVRSRVRENRGRRIGRYSLTRKGRRELLGE